MAKSTTTKKKEAKVLTLTPVEKGTAVNVEAKGDETNINLLVDGKTVGNVPAADKIAEDKIVIEEFISNNDNRVKAADAAYKIQQELPHWFTVPKLVKIFKVETPDAARQIEILMWFNMCVGRVENGKGLFKIDLDRKEQRRLILEEIEAKNKEITFLEEKLVKLN